MSLISKLRNGVAKADKVVNTKGQVTVEVLHLAWVTVDGKGKRTYADPVPLKAILQPKYRRYTTQSGKLVEQTAILTFTYPVDPNGTVTTPPRREPIDPEDKFLLGSDRTESPILEVDDVLRDSGTGKPLMHVVTLGRILSA